ncbi:MAG: hypothetical protein QXP55_05465 [Nitrososphaerales archaeon]
MAERAERFYGLYTERMEELKNCIVHKNSRQAGEKLYAALVLIKY